MGFFKGYQKLLGLIVVLFLCVCMSAAQAASAPAPAKKAVVVKKTVKKTPKKTVKKVEKKTDKKAAPKKEEAPKPELRSPYSLEGQTFNKIKNEDRISEDDAARYAHIFAFQDVSDFRKANEEIKKLTDHRLMGHVLAQRYTGQDYRATYTELADWMKLYGDHPPASRIYALAQSRRPKSATDALAEPRVTRGMAIYHDFDSGQLASPYMADQNNSPRERDIMAEISRNLSESPTTALNRLNSPEARSLFSNTKYDALRAQIAESYFYNGSVDKAYSLAVASAARSGREIPLAGWIAGLCAWKMGQYGDAAKFFEITASSKRASAWMLSAGAHWAARSYLRNHQPQKVAYWLKRAAEHSRSFYGVISMKILGMEQARFNWEMPELRNRLVKTLAKIPAGGRALALTDARRPVFAEQELRQINPGDDKILQEAMMALAHKSGAPAFEMRLGSGLKNKHGQLYDAALYPEAPWQPEGGYPVDKALVYAFIRQESKFEAGVKNDSSGAIGLMQLMPATAQLVAKKHKIRVEREDMQEPAVNMRLGQRYLADLLADPVVGNNLFKLAVAYNAGPGKLARWEKEVKFDNDPLFFIEAIPVSETRAFVERVLTNYWIYRLKYGQSTDSLERLAAGEWPMYTMDSKPDDAAPAP